MKQFSLTCGGIMVTASMAIGHPGHEAIAPAGDPLHYLINPAHIVMTVAANTGVDFVDTASTVREERTRIEDVLERALGLAPPSLSTPEGDAEQVQVTFRVRVDANRAERGVFIVGKVIIAKV